MLAVPIITQCLTETNNKLIQVMGGRFKGSFQTDAMMCMEGLD